MKTVPVASHDKIHTDPEFQAQLDEILSRELDARTIDSYADEALVDLVALVRNIVATQSFDNDLAGIERERQALRNVGLDPQAVETTLDHIADVSESTKRLDSLVMRKTQLVDRVIVPPDDSISPNITPGDGSFELPKERIPKLKTLLLLLEKGLDVDIEDDNQVRITAGAVRSNMMRSASYYMVEVPSLERTVFVCDEVGNTTFVFDSVVCDGYGITTDDLSGSTKPELKDLLEEDETLGQKIDYSSRYVDQLAAALNSETSTKDSSSMEVSTIDILRPKAPPAPEGYLSIKGMYHEYGIAPRTLQKAVTALGDALGATTEYQFGPKTATGYSPDQQRMIIEFLDIAPPAPEGYLSIEGMRHEYGTHSQTLQKAVTALGDALGATMECRFGRKTATGYSPDQQRQILDWIHQNNKRVRLGSEALRALGFDS